jgi:nitrous oxidase accessory protein NosD
MKLTRTACAVAAGTLAAAVGLGTPASASSPVVVVPAGGSIQQALDDAAPGSTIQLLPGVYSGGVAVHTDGITIRGAGPATVLEPGAVDHCAPQGAGSGICVFGRPTHLVTDVHVESLTLHGFEEFGMVGLFTDRLTVTRVTARGNGDYGIAEFVSTRGSFTHNRVIENAAEAGIYIGDIPDAGGTEVADNFGTGNEMGVLVRHAHHVFVTGNVLVGNCTGVALVDDGQPGSQGDTRVSDNVIADNNKVCPQNQEIPPLAGTGVVLFGGQRNTVTANRIVNNHGDGLISGGVVLISGVSGVPASGNLITGNVIRHNGPFDIVDGTGAVNSLGGNNCGSSLPNGLCSGDG